MLNRRQFGWAGGAFLLAAGSAKAFATDFHTSEFAASRLKRIHLFAFGGVGFAMQISAGEKCYAQVVAAEISRALPLLEDVFSNGTPEAKCYALVGLRKLQPERLQVLVATVAASTEMVEQQHGCVGSIQKLGEFARQIADHGYAA